MCFANQEGTLACVSQQLGFAMRSTGLMFWEQSGFSVFLQVLRGLEEPGILLPTLQLVDDPLPSICCYMAHTQVLG